MEADGSLPNDVYAILGRVQTLVSSEISAFFETGTPDFTEPGVTPEQVVFQRCAVELYQQNFADDVPYLNTLEDQARSVAADADRFAAEVTLGLTRRYPNISWLVGAETVRRIKEDLCGCERRTNLDLPEPGFYESLNEDPKRLARIIRISWTKPTRCAYFEPLFVGHEPSPDDNNENTNTSDDAEKTNENAELSASSPVDDLKQKLVHRVERAMRRDDFHLFSARRQSRLVHRILRRTLARERKRWSNPTFIRLAKTILRSVRPAATEVRTELQAIIDQTELRAVIDHNESATRWKTLVRHFDFSRFTSSARTLSNNRDPRQPRPYPTKPTDWWDSDEAPSSETFETAATC